ncbi:MAG: hypothetical protein KME21_09075 [Desmonostoc vinosum HA7617-LM4]|jgi:hypothetical protein|nr:hypothetical protein [Desmonostoc vinosum HA7617-LM4]
MQLALGNFSSFTLLWALATFGGFLLSLLLIEIGEKPDIGLVESAVGGLAVALPQSFLLKQPVFRIKWVFSSLLGWMIVAATGIGAIGWVVPTTSILALRILSGLIYGTISGLTIGIAQWLVIPQSVPLAWRWIFVSSLSWAIAVPIGSTVGIVLRHFTQLFLGEVIGLAITWLVVAILTGIYADKLRSG